MMDSEFQSIQLVALENGEGLGDRSEMGIKKATW